MFALLIFYLTALVTTVNAFGNLRTRQFEAPGPNDFLDWNQPSNLTEWDPERWVLSTSVFTPNAYQVQPYVANGYHGSRLTAEGAGYWRIRNETGDTWPINGWPLDNPRQTVATISGFWDVQKNTTRTNFPELLENGWESVISGIPTWTSFVIATPDGQHAYTPGVDPKTVEQYRQYLSIRNGIVTTDVVWRPVCDGPAYNIRLEALAHRKRVNLGMMRITVSASDDTEVILTDLLDGEGAQRTSFNNKEFVATDTAIWSAVNPQGIEDVTAVEYSVLDFQVRDKADLKALKETRKNAEDRPWVSTNSSTISQEFTAQIKKGDAITVLKYVGIASTDAFPDPAKTAFDEAHKARKAGWNKLVKEHQAAWDSFWEDADVEIHGGDEVLEMQIAMRASLFHLLSNIRSEKEGPTNLSNSVSVGGLSSDSYAGLVFWDADLWMLPGLLVLHPEHAEAINNYRFKMFPQAQENARQYGLDGVLYPWTSARYGNCTATGPCVDYQYHLNTDIALVHWHQFLTTGDTKWLKEKGWPIIEAVAQMWTTKVKASNTSGADGLEVGMYTVQNMTDPDEYANHIDNGAFTNAGVKVIMGIAKKAAEVLGIQAPAKWTDIENKMFIPYNSEAGIIPEYATMNGSVTIKQADVILINYPLEFRLNESQALNDLDFYARAQSADGPAMTWAMFAIDALELSPHGCASWTYTLYASQPYLREPYYQFSEQIIDDIYVNGNTNPAFTFLTGHGGFLQIPIHGYTGYRPRLDAFYLDPSLPPQISAVSVKGMKHQDAEFNVHVGQENTTITRRPDQHRGHRSPVKVMLGARNPLAGEHTLLPGDSLVVPTRRPDRNGTDIPGNIAECQPVFSPQRYVPGQFPVGGVDGSNHTNWRPVSPDPSDLIVDLGESKTFSKLALNWAQWPPLRFEVAASDEGVDGPWKKVWEQDEVAISEPWDEDTALEVRMKKGNQTNVDLGEQGQGRWMKLTIEGDREAKGRGGTVAQFAVL
ncbi:hypothetical protein EX30DRAFT_372957 [Ascodesmis nigricans]|uniref:alpha,alpha-trehalase n=1 Tax=Ascodesmis nigricans TaxID=341454 RepID=A0A4S2MT49_9PEZI|nr:hypothetical protein EX30DRAFT_372957 [Ascodesmis nigricans]